MNPSSEQHNTALDAAMNAAYRAFAADNPGFNIEEIDLSEAIAAYLSALPEQPGERWRPIETAPKELATLDFRNYGVDLLIAGVLVRSWHSRAFDGQALALALKINRASPFAPSEGPL